MHRNALILLFFTTATPVIGQQAPAPAPPAKVTAAQFAALKWLEGTWRGSGGRDAVFYEDARWVDDSTVARRSFTDSTLASVSEESQIIFSGGEVWQVRNGARRVSAVLVTADSIRFSSGVLFVRRGTDHWSAILGGGRVVYEMRRYRP